MKEKELIEKLKECGLTKGESKVYLALLTGKSTKSGIIRKSGVSSSIIYEILERLIKKGLASSVIIEGKKHFQANEPKSFLEILKKNIKNKRKKTNC